jgi:hypothetical protein
MRFLGGKRQIKNKCNNKGNKISRLALRLRSGLRQNGGRFAAALVRGAEEGVLEKMVSRNKNRTSAAKAALRATHLRHG